MVFSRFHRHQTFRLLAATVAGCMIAQTVMPIAALALTEGPTQPEFSTFQPVSTTEMVNPFTGEFTYNLPLMSVPGPHGSGYPISLSYSSGRSGEDEASWVGKGWTLNTGAIIRNKRGLPDDYHGGDVVYWNKLPDNWIVTAGKNADIEAFGDEKNIGFNGDVLATYNNRHGFNFVWTFTESVKGLGSIGVTSSDGDYSFSGSLTPVSEFVDDIVKHPSQLTGIKPSTIKQYGRNILRNSAIGAYFLGEETRLTNIPQTVGESYNISGSVAYNPASFPIGGALGVRGSYTVVRNVASEALKGFGFLYSADAGVNDAMDYSNEHDSPYNARDLYLSAPYNNADQFLVQGEGVGGAFRAFQRGVGYFGPSHKESYIQIDQLDGQVHVGATFGVGVKAGIGLHTTEATRYHFSTWELGFKSFKAGPTTEEPYFFRFNNDMSGEVSYSANSAPSPALRGMYTSVNNGVTPSRSKYIGYSTIQETASQPPFQCGGWAGGPNYYRSYNKNKESRDWVARDDASIQQGIGEYSVVSADGRRYVYGLPVYARNESALQYDVQGVQALNGRQVFAARNTDAKKVIGQQLKTPYATMYLLTELTSPDYVDRNNDGPSSDDFGGYTLFHYRRTAGANNKSSSPDADWYKWRSPYNGMSLSRGSLSDPRDDMGGVNYGEKEIYYLESIETKTHIARFILNDSINTPRRDGYEADHSELSATASSTATTATSTSSVNKLRYLTKIELLAKDTLGHTTKLLQTTHLEYDYSLCEDLPNAQPKSGGRYGALTLRRLYTEYEGTIGARISPYVFGYEYKKSSNYSALPSHLEDTLYKSVISYGDRFISHPELENPKYSVYNTDGWGSYRYGGRHCDSISAPWIDQTPDTTNFDPAAWQLKWIQLPSGGEIHVQYEQADYRYVQNRDVMGMAGLRTVSGADGSSETVSEVNNYDVKYYLNLDSLGISSGSTGAIVDAIKTQYVDRGERMYFKFLYTLVGSGSPNFNNCTSEYITGWVYVREVGTESGLVYVKLGLPVGYTLPRQVCDDFARTMRSGILDPTGHCNPALAPVQVPTTDPGEAFMMMLGSFGNPYQPDGDRCAVMNLDHSYLRIPILKDKKGGGIRVKRLLMFDKGIEAGAAGLYGTEYEYRLADGRSSGVATNEPTEIREENPLVVCLDKRIPMNWYQHIISGTDKEQFEGPIGEGVLPGPSVGYSRVVAHSIFQGKSNTGYSVYEYNTAKDYPFDMHYSVDGKNLSSTSWSPMEKVGADDVQLGSDEGLLKFEFAVFNRLQGYSFMVNSMHGQIRSVSTYAGSPSGNGGQVSRQAYIYFKPGEKIPVMRTAGTIEQEYLGREMDVTVENRAIRDFTHDAKVAADFTIGISIIPIPWFTVSPQYIYGERGIVTHVTTKVIHYPVIVKSVESFRDGNTSLVENIAFDPVSGQALVTRATDGYNTLKVNGDTTARNGSYYSYSIPAYTQYPNMGPISGNQRTILKSDNGLAIQKVYADRHSLMMQFSGSRSPSKVMGYFSSGDLVRVSNSSGGILGVFNIGEIKGNQIELLPVYYCTLNTEALVPNVTVEVIRSGRRNQLTASVGSFTTYGTPAVLKRHAAQ
jgi:hypothetical protein